MFGASAGDLQTRSGTAGVGNVTRGADGRFGSPASQPAPRPTPAARSHLSGVARSRRFGDHLRVRLLRGRSLTQNGTWEPFASPSERARPESGAESQDELGEGGCEDED